MSSNCLLLYSWLTNQTPELDSTQVMRFCLTKVTWTPGFGAILNFPTYMNFIKVSEIIS